MSDFEREIQAQPPTTAIEEVPAIPENRPYPIPVTPVPSADSIANYSIQGVIVTLVIALGKPLIDKFYEFFSSSAKSKAALEEEKYKQSVRASNILEESYKEQRSFMQESMISQGKAFSTAIQQLTEVKQRNTEMIETFLAHVDKNFSIDNEDTKRIIKYLQEIGNSEQETLKLLMTISRNLKAVTMLCDKVPKDKQRETE